MPKRKRGDEDAAEPDTRSSARQQRIQHKVKFGATKLGHAFKIAKGFERQKLGRRRKNAVEQKDGKDVVRIDSEIEALKTLDTSASAQQHLFKTLLKVKSIAAHPDLPPQVKRPANVSSDAATLNVIARLCKSNQAKAALETALVDIQKALGLEPDRPASEKKKRRLRANDYNNAASKAESARDRPLDAERPASRPQESSSVTPEPLRAEGEDDELDAYHGRIASSADSTEGEFSDVGDLEQRLLEESVPGNSSIAKLQKYDVEADLSISGSDPRSSSASPEPQKAGTSKKASFLPSLTMGGYISGSDSEAEDIDIAPKKNRRGQRARQQIWEKKYGNTAKHLQKQGRAVLWDPKRGAVEGKERRQHGKAGRQRRGSPEYVMGGNSGTKSAHAAKIHRDDDGALHPSWEAAKKAKEKKVAPVTFSGKKTTFD